jgi:hypothetical protein
VLQLRAGVALPLKLIPVNGQKPKSKEQFSDLKMTAVRALGVAGR